MRDNNRKVENLPSLHVNSILCVIVFIFSEKVFRPCKILSVESVSHDTKLLSVELPEGTRMCVPLGYHIHIKHCVSGIHDILRSVMYQRLCLRYT